MLTNPAFPDRVLIEPSELEADWPLPVSAAHRDALRTVAAWAGDYLCRAHPELGRRGPVCPYVQGALRRRTFYLAVQPGLPANREQVVATVLGFRDWYEEFAADQHLTFLIVFPDLTPPDVVWIIDGTQHAMKTSFVERGLMIGEFHDGPPAKSGRWNARFRPLRSPVPLLAIRRMVPTDLPFLRDDPQHVAAYATRFPHPRRDHVLALPR